ncbi:MAG TPA: M36 family metallopeptidase [Pyrinomonadaceae bacterium]|nr:M36 family metallopeptidase [Pyrinomonadaceae bacterium]
MKKNFNAKIRRSLLSGFIVSGLAAAFIFLPGKFRSSAGSEQKSEANSASRKSESRDAALENYDIRTDKRAEKIGVLDKFRQASGKGAAVSRFEKEKVSAAENSLRQQVPNLKIEYNDDLRIPEIIAPDVKTGRAFLTTASELKRPDRLRFFVKQNKDLIGVGDLQASRLEEIADYTNPDGNLSFAHLEQKLDNIPVFRGEIKAAFTRRGEIVRVVNNLAPGLDASNVSSDFGNPSDAVKFAAGYLNYALKSGDILPNDAESTDLKKFFGEGEWSPTAEKMYFPVEAGVARAAWRVLVWKTSNAFYVIVDAETGEMLWRKNITEDQTQAATYGVYANPNAMINVARNPFSLAPGAVNPALGTQGAAIERGNVTRVGNEAPYDFNNKGWIADGGTETEGNAVEAGIDRDGTNGIDPQGRAVAAANRSFVFDYAPGNPNTNAGDAPVPETQTYPISAFQNGAVTQLFYVSNWYHDETYRLGFTEAAFNFQNDNFGRGGAGQDRVSAEAQDSSGTNNANFSTPADGSRGRMQMFLWDGPNPAYDGDFDADVVVHELSHGLSHRLHGNSGGLTSNMAGAMGEGWSDFYALSLLSQPGDPVDGVYPMGSYATYLGGAVYTANNYYGIRRFPKAVMSAVGANGKPHNPLSFRHLNPSCNREIGTSGAIGTISAYPRGYYGSTTCDQVHAAGEIWSSALWEVRARFIRRLGWAVGNRKALQLVTDAMKLSPLNPTFLQGRDAIVAAALANPSAADAKTDAADIWAGFAVRGMGFTASIANSGAGINNASVKETFDLPNLLQTPGFTMSDALGNNNGVAEPGESTVLYIPLTNSTGETATGTTLRISGGGAASYGDIQNNQTATRSVAFTVPANQACGAILTLTLNIDSSLGAKTETRILIIGQPVVVHSEKFDGVTAPALPTGWTTAQTGTGVNWATKTGTSDTIPNSAFAQNTGESGGTTGGGADLESPGYNIGSEAAVLKFRNNFNTEKNWDGGALEISVGGAAYKDVLDAGGEFLEGGYNGALGVNQNPLDGRPAWTGNSNGYITTRVLLPASAKGKTVRFKWRFGQDTNTFVTGWNVDSVEVTADYLCGSAPVKSKTRADFDGDGKTDLSVFRSAEGNWFIQKSRDGFTAANWGISTDAPAPADFDGDGKTDIAVFRPSNGVWYIARSSDGGFQSIQFGTSEDKIVAADYDGDGKTDVAVYRPSNGTWYLNRSRDGFSVAQFGISTDTPDPGDYDGDGKTDVAVYRNGTWIINKSSGGVSYASFGLGGDKTAQADYDGDGKTDIAVYRPSNGVWYIQKSRDGFVSAQFGISTDAPVPGDYDGDGKTDIAVYRGGTWYINRSRDGFSTAGFGVAADIPIPK